MSSIENFSPYCPVCSGCGEDGCCSAVICKQDSEGAYCQTYLKDLKFSYSILKNISEVIFKEGNEEKYKELIELYDYYFDLHWERIFNNQYEKK